MRAPGVNSVSEAFSAESISSNFYNQLESIVARNNGLPHH